MNESFVQKNTELETIETKISELQGKINDTLGPILVKEELLDPGQEIQEHLYGQVGRVVNELNISSDEGVNELLKVGIIYDVEIEENGASNTEMIIDNIDDIKKLFKRILEIDFSVVPDEILNLCVTRLIEDKGNKPFLDAFIDVVQTRKQIMKEIEDQTYLVDSQTSSVIGKM